MGPQLCSCGNQMRWIDAEVIKKLQWGRNFAVAETHPAMLTSWRVRRFNGAATLQLRKREWVCGRCRHSNASMGPQLCSCGNVLAAQPPAYPLPMLQWGRNFAVAETSAKHSKLCMEYRLQWGRNFAVAETRQKLLTETIKYKASMGPQLCSCGNLLVREIDSRGVQLQWGRNFAVAETANESRCGVVPYSLQWGRNFAVAETLQKVVDRRLGDAASMGPQLCSCGNGIALSRRRQ